VVTISRDYADNTRFADEWLPLPGGTDAALSMAMSQVESLSYAATFGGFVAFSTYLPTYGWRHARGSC
jgi:nitrate reductase alpha subunit